jgi:SET domain-containing protein
MLLVETFLAVSPGKGVGLYAKSLIPMGMKYWERNEVYDKIISPAEMETLPELAAKYIKTYGFLEPNGNWYLCRDNARFSNHSDNANSSNLFDEDGAVLAHIATRDIKEGEEISCDYTELCQTCKEGITFIENS